MCHTQFVDPRLYDYHPFGRPTLNINCMDTLWLSGSFPVSPIYMISKTHSLEICLDQITFVDKTTNFNIKRYCINYSALYSRPILISYRF